MTDMGFEDALPLRRSDCPPIGIHAKAGVGKDTVAEYLIRVYGYGRLTFADPVKDCICLVCGISRAELEQVKDEICPQFGVTYRHMLQTLGTDWGRKLVHPDIWVKVAEREILHAGGLVASDVRFENEAAFIRDRGGLMIFIQGPSRREVATRTHESEAGVLFHPATDRLVSNDGTLWHLYDQVDEVMQGLGVAPVDPALRAPR